MTTSVAHRARPNALLAALLVSVGSYTLMQTMVVPALPVLTEKLETDTGTAAWLITAFLLGSAVLTPVISALGDRFGHRRMLLVTLLAFLASTAGAAAAPNVETLIAMRAAEGVSMAMLPLALAIIRESMPPERIAASFGVTAAMLGGGAGLGLLVGGLIIEDFSWRWMFGFEAVLIVVAAALVMRFVPETPRRPGAADRGVDVLGAVLLAGALSLLLLGITQGDAWGWTSPGLLGLFAGSLALFAVLVVVENRQADPLVDLRLFAHPPMLVTNLASLLLGVVPFFFYVLLPLLLQMPGEIAEYGQGHSVVESGLLLLPASVCTMAAGGATAPLQARFGPRAPLFAAMILMTAGAVTTALWHGGTFELAALFCLVGAGSGFGFAALADLVASIVPRQELAAGNGLNTVVRTVGSAIGSQAAAALLEARTIADTGIPSESAFTSGFWLAAALGAVGIVLVAVLRPRAYRSGPAPTATPSRPQGAATH
ncbi:MFS transporter [Streptomyces sp. URMC 129]|uniref:MFS transporter n=1 Tax=Streptomyces sp. URMC 129 TaxID=3423407 RepID=UPI003F1BA11F